MLDVLSLLGAIGNGATNGIGNFQSVQANQLNQQIAQQQLNTQQQAAAQQQQAQSILAGILSPASGGINAGQPGLLSGIGSNSNIGTTPSITPSASQNDIGSILSAVQTAQNQGSQPQQSPIEAPQQFSEISIQDVFQQRNDLQQQISTRVCLLYTSPSPRDKRQSRMPSSA